MSDLDKHLATIDELLAGNTRPIFDENNPQRKLPPPADAVLYRSAPGTHDGAMDLKPRIDMSKFAMPILGQVDMNGDPVTRATAPQPLAVIGGRGSMARMMPLSPPIRPVDQALELHVGAGGMTPGEDQTTNAGATPSVAGGSDPTPGTWGQPDLPSRAPAPQTGDMISLLRGLFQGAL